jgi:hypothetical protein
MYWSLENPSRVVVSDQAKFEFMPFLVAKCPNWDVLPEMTDNIKAQSKNWMSAPHRHDIEIASVAGLCAMC